MTEREDSVYKAKLANQTERYDEMAKIMKEVAVEYQDLNDEEMNLLYVAYKYRIGAKRASWRTIHKIEINEHNNGTECKLEIIKQHRFEIEKELKEICQDILHVLEKHLIPIASSAESKVFYYKMQGDFYRYLAEFVTGEDREGIVKSSLDAYSAASEIAKAELPVTHPLRLKLALKLSVLYFEILDDLECACKVAKTAIDDAMEELHNLSAEDLKKCTVILQLFKDNLTLWTSDQEQDGEDVKHEKAKPQSEVGLPHKEHS